MSLRQGHDSYMAKDIHRIPPFNIAPRRSHSVLSPNTIFPSLCYRCHHLWLRPLLGLQKHFQKLLSNKALLLYSPVLEPHTARYWKKIMDPSDLWSWGEWPCRLMRTSVWAGGFRLRRCARPGAAFAIPMCGGCLALGERVSCDGGC